MLCRAAVLCAVLPLRAAVPCTRAIDTCGCTATRKTPQRTPRRRQPSHSGMIGRALGLFSESGSCGIRSVRSHASAGLRCFVTLETQSPPVVQCGPAPCCLWPGAMLYVAALSAAPRCRPSGAHCVACFVMLTFFCCSTLRRSVGAVHSTASTPPASTPESRLPLADTRPEPSAKYCSRAEPY